MEGKDASQTHSDMDVSETIKFQHNGITTT